MSELLWRLGELVVMGFGFHNIGRIVEEWFKSTDYYKKWNNVRVDD